MSPQDAGNRNASAPDVREAAEAVIRDFDRWRECEGPSNESAVAWRKFAESLDPLRAALASPDAPSGCIAAPVSPPAASRDAVAEVLLHEAHPDLAPWSLLQLSGPNAAGIVVAVALARRQADAILSRWSAPPAPRGEAVAIREACAKACVIAARECPGSSDEETTWREAAMWCLNRIRALPLPAAPAPIATPHDRDEWKARAERAEALLHDVEAALDNAGVARSTAPTVDACTDRDTPDRYPRLAQADRVKVLAKSEKDILDRLLDADTATRKAEARYEAMAKQYEDAMEVIHRNAGARRDGLCGILAWIDTVKAERDSARAELAEQRKLWEQIPGGPDYDADENDLSPDDAASHLAGIAIRRIDAETRGAGE